MHKPWNRSIFCKIGFQSLSLWLLVGTTLVFVACKPPPPPPFCLPAHKINDLGDTLESFAYEAGKIIEWERRDEKKTYRYFYERGLLVREEILDENGNNLESWIYAYNFQDQLTKRSHIKNKDNGEMEELAFTDFFYADGKMKRSSTYDPGKNPPLQLAEARYSWQNGLLNKISMMEQNPLPGIRWRVAETREFIYDNKINPFDTIGWFRISEGKHNLTTENRTIFIYSASGKDTSFIRYADSLWYNYNEYGYPVQVMTQTKTGDFSTRSIGYECE